MLCEMRIYRIQPGALERYLQLFESKGPPIISRDCTLVVFWVLDTGRLNRVI
jgi:NIPSNAP